MSAVRHQAATEHSGRLLLRMPKHLHGELARAAEREGVSLNRLIVMRLSGSLRAGDAAATQPSPRRSRLLVYALAANFVVLVGAAAAAIALLVIAYR